MTAYAHPDPSSATRLEEVPHYDAKDLIAQGSVARIKLDDKIYTLRITRQGKLILTK